MFKRLLVPERLFWLAMWIVSLVFASFLIGLGGTIIGDLPRVERPLTIEQFADQTVLQRARTEIRRLREIEGGLVNREAQASLQVTAANNAYQSARTRTGFRHGTPRPTRGRTRRSSSARGSSISSRQVPARRRSRWNESRRISSIQDRRLPPTRRPSAT
jgi:hypothetical protein